MAKASIEQPPIPVVVVDLDETLFSAPYPITALNAFLEKACVVHDQWQAQQWMRNFWVKLKTWLEDCFEVHGFLRPGTMDFLKGLRAWKATTAGKVVLFSMSCNAFLWVELVAETLNDMAGGGVVDKVVARENVEEWYEARAPGEVRSMLVSLPRGEILKGLKPLAAVAAHLGLDMDMATVKFVVVDDLPLVVRGPCVMMPVTPFLGPDVTDKAVMLTALAASLVRHLFGVDGGGYAELPADVGAKAVVEDRSSRDFTCGDFARDHALSDVLSKLLTL